MKIKIVLLMLVALVATTQAELLLNGDFEGGVYGGTTWYYTFGLTYTDVPNNWNMNYAGFSSGHTYFSTGGADGGGFIRLNDYSTGSWASLYQTVSVVGGEQYAFSVWTKSVSGDAPWGRINWDVGTDVSVGSTGAVAGSTWASLDFGTHIAPAGATTATIYVGTWGNDVAGIDSVDYDNASFSLVPEPITISLLGLGALMLRRRK